MTTAGPSLRRLLRAEVAHLLDDMTAAVPGLRLAVVDGQGRVAERSGGWAADALDGMPDATSSHHADGVRRLALSPREEPLGWLVAAGDAPERLLVALQRSLSLLMSEALDRHDLARETLERYREINLLYRAAGTIGASLDVAEVPLIVLSEIERVVPARGALVLVAESESESAAEWGPGVARGDPVEVAGLRDAAAPLIATVRQTGRPDISVWPSRTGELHSALCAPMLAGERVLGVIVLVRTAPPIFDAGDEKLLLGLASQAGIAIERTWLHERETRRQRLEEELAVARRIQLTLLPAGTPQIAGWNVAATYKAARQVGGDFYDFLVHDPPSRRLGMVIADVTGKGVPAALMMAYSRAVVRAESMAGRGPADVLRRTNRLIMQDRQTRLFLTAFYAEIELDTGRLVFASAGHEAPLWLTSAGDCRELDAPGVLLGAFDDVGLEEREVRLGPGDTVIFYTDGVTEARSPGGELFGDERLRQSAMAAMAADGSAGAVLAAISRDVAAFTAEAAQADDLTMMIVSRENGEEAAWSDGT